MSTIQDHQQSNISGPQNSFLNHLLSFALILNNIFFYSGFRALFYQITINSIHVF